MEEGGGLRRPMLRENNRMWIKKGTTLVELMLGLAISSIVLSMLLMVGKNILVSYNREVEMKKDLNKIKNLRIFLRNEFDNCGNQDTLVRGHEVVLVRKDKKVVISINNEVIRVSYYSNYSRKLFEQVFIEGIKNQKFHLSSNLVYISFNLKGVEHKWNYSIKRKEEE